MTETKQSWAGVFDFIGDAAEFKRLDYIAHRLIGLDSMVRQATGGTIRLSTHVHEQGLDLIEGPFVTIYGLLLLIDHGALHDGTSDVMAKAPLFAIRAHNPVEGKPEKYGLDVTVSHSPTTFTKWHDTQEGVIETLESVLREFWFKGFFAKLLKLAILANNNLNPQGKNK